MKISISYFFRRAFLYSILFSILAVNIFAKTVNIRFDRISVDNGLSQSVVNCLFQDMDGFIWIGTKDGLNRYDGYNFKIFKNDPTINNSISNNTINTVFQDKNGVIWIGTADGINLIGKSWKGFKRVFFKSINFKNSVNNITAIMRIGKNRKLIGTWGAGVLLIDNNNKILSHFFNREDNNSLTNNKIKSIYRDRKDNIWILTVSGLNKILDFNGRVKRYLYKKISKNDLESNVINTIKELSDSRLLVGLSTHGVFEYSEKDDNFHHINLFPNNHTVFKNITEIIENEENIWFGTDGQGLIRIDKKGDFQQYTNDEYDQNSLCFNEVLCMLKDREGSIWIGTDQGGISKFNIDEIKFNSLKRLKKNKKYLRIKGVWAINRDNDYLWIGTDSKGLIKLNLENNEYNIYSKSVKNSINHNQILSLCKSKDDILWIGTDGEGLNKFNLRTGRVEYFIYDEKNPFSIGNDYILSIYEDEDETLWIGSYAGGLSKLPKNSSEFINFIHNEKNIQSIAGNFVVKIERDDNEHLWIGTNGFGLDHFNKRTGVFKHYKHSDKKNFISSDTILSILKDDEANILWVGTQGGGLNRLDIDSGIFTYYMEKDGLVNNTVTGIVKDDSGMLWLSTRGGISRFDPKMKIFRNYDKRDGIQSKEFNFGSYFKDKNGIIYFGGINGLNFFNPKSIKDNLYSPVCKITEVKIGGENINLVDINKTGLSVKYDKFPIIIEFSALSFVSPEKNKYAYKIEGIDNKWHFTDAKLRRIVYNSLPYGNFVLCFKGTNNDGIWQETESRVSLNIIPPFWQTLYFKILALFFFGIVSYLLIGFIRRHIKLITFWKQKKQIGNFLILDEIGSGGMGTIYRASNITDKNKIVALKVLKREFFKDPNSRKRFKQESVIVDQLEHPNIVKVIERGISGENMYMAMELLEGKTLSDKIREEKQLNLDEIYHIIFQIIDALKSVHAKNIVHRDLKPDNVMIIKKGNDNNFVKLLDFGLATTEYQTRLTQTGAVVGTVNYMAKEQITKAISNTSTDIYSLGVMLYEMITGQKPFIGNSVVQVMKQIVEDKPISPQSIRDDVPDELNDLIQKMLSKKGENRPSLNMIISTVKKLSVENKKNEKINTYN